LIERKNRYQTAIDNSTEKEELCSSDVDLNKISIAEYNAIKFYLKFAIDLYNEGKDKDFFNKSNPYE
jgi:hypothetical protein